MSIKTTNEALFEKISVEGVYGYIVFIAATVIAINNVLPLATFGIVFGEFLSTLGDETTGTSLANGILNTILSLTGLIANILLNKWSCRNVGLLGALACSISCFSLIFVQDLIWFIVFFGIVQGFGYGLLFPASLTALNNCFTQKLPFMMSLSQTLLIAFTMLMPPLANTTLNNYSYRGTLLWIAALSLLNIPSSIALSRMKCTYKQIPEEAETKFNNIAYAEHNQISMKCKSIDDFTNSAQPLIKEHNSLKDVASPKECRIVLISNKTASVVNVTEDVVNKESQKMDASVRTPTDLSLLTNPKYLNISLGLSLSFSSDLAFISIIPVMLSDVGFTNSEVAFAMSTFFGCDLVSRCLLSMVLAVRSPRSRYLFMCGSFLSAIFRTGFVLNHRFLWKIITLGALGFLRSFIQTPLPLVISEEYRNQFATAYSLYMVICGVVTLVFGLLIGAVKSLTNSDVMVCHLLTCCYMICVVSWVGEMMLHLRKKRKEMNEEPANFL